MSEVVKLRTRAEVEEEAAAWIWRMDCGAGGADPGAFEDWLRQDPRHRRLQGVATQHRRRRIQGGQRRSQRGRNRNGQGR